MTTTKPPRKSTTSKRGLRAVAADEKPPAEPAKPKVLSLASAIEAGDYLEILRAQRREMVRDVGTEKGPAKAAMHRQIALLSKEIAALEAERKAAAAEEGSGGDEGASDEAFDPEAL